MKHVAIESPTDGLEKIFTKERGYRVTVVTPASTLPDADLVVFSGGADINPFWYNQKCLPCTHYSTSRDIFSIKLRARYKSIPKVGVCRGAQFLCVMNGGSLWQDVPGHHMGKRKVHDWPTGRLVEGILEDHHQGCRPLSHWICIATGAPYLWATDATGTTDSSDYAEDPIVAYEAFYIPKDKALCVQFHPEWGDAATEDYFWELMKRYIKCFSIENTKEV